ncbi:hypothetical protein HDV05_000241 [Chytridiales sp. JEL 0842]|nr:hypothetical protein HDV05_000241 [Chytridiales sp. JEL 0842]
MAQTVEDSARFVVKADKVDESFEKASEGEVYGIQELNDRCFEGVEGSPIGLSFSGRDVECDRRTACGGVGPAVDGAGEAAVEVVRVPMAGLEKGRVLGVRGGWELRMPDWLAGLLLKEFEGVPGPPVDGVATPDVWAEEKLREEDDDLRERSVPYIIQVMTELLEDRKEIQGMTSQQAPGLAARNKIHNRNASRGFAGSLVTNHACTGRKHASSHISKPAKASSSDLTKPTKGSSSASPAHLQSTSSSLGQATAAASSSNSTPAVSPSPANTDYTPESNLHRSLSYYHRTYTKLKEFWIDAAVLDRLYYKNKNQHKSAGHFRKLQMKAMKKLQGGSEALSTVVEGRMPPGSILVAALASILDAYIVMNKISQACLDMYAAFRAVASQTYFMSLSMTVMSVAARLRFLLTNKMMKDVEEIYRILYEACLIAKQTPEAIAVLGNEGKMPVMNASQKPTVMISNVSEMEEDDDFDPNSSAAMVKPLKEWREKFLLLPPQLSDDVWTRIQVQMAAGVFVGGFSELGAFSSSQNLQKEEFKATARRSGGLAEDTFTLDDVEPTRVVFKKSMHQAVSLIHADSNADKLERDTRDEEVDEVRASYSAQFEKNEDSWMQQMGMSTDASDIMDSFWNSSQKDTDQDNSKAVSTFSQPSKKRARALAPDSPTDPDSRDALDKIKASSAETVDLDDAGLKLSLPNLSTLSPTILSREEQNAKKLKNKKVKKTTSLDAVAVVDTVGLTFSPTKPALPQNPAADKLLTTTIETQNKEDTIGKQIKKKVKPSTLGDGLKKKKKKKEKKEDALDEMDLIFGF